MNIVEELEDILSLAEDDERFALNQCITLLKRVHKLRAKAEEREPVDLEWLKDVYETNIRLGIPREEWHRAVLNYEAYEVLGNVNGSGSDLPGTARPLAMGAKEEWGVADVYPLTTEGVNVQH